MKRLNQYIIDLNEAIKYDVKIVGHKAFNLSTLMKSQCKNQFIIASGYCLISKAYEQHISKCDLNDEIKLINTEMNRIPYQRFGKIEILSNIFMEE